MFGLGYGLLIKIALVVLLVGGTLGGVYLHFKHDRDNLQALGAANERILSLEADLLIRTQEVSSLNARIKANNLEKLEQVAQAKAAEEKARKEATEAREAKKRIAGQLADARRRYEESINSDENLRVYRTAGVPIPVLERLRSANGETGDGVRTGPPDSGEIHSPASGFTDLLALFDGPGKWQ